MKYFTKSHIFLYIVVAIAIFVLYKTISLPYHGVIDIVISKQNGVIKSVDTARKIGKTHKMSVDRLYFPKARHLSHKRFGMLGFKENFFIKARVDMQVHESGVYHFMVASDDGFRLKIGDELVCEHPGNRPFQKNNCKVKLTQGKHHFDLDYFQGGGPLGLHVKYALNTQSLRDVGEDSTSITFMEIN